MDVLNALSTGLLLGTALGVIIPEYVTPKRPPASNPLADLIRNFRGIEVLVESYKESEALTFHIAMNLIFGFLLMMIVEHLVAGNHGHLHGPAFANGANSQLEFDAELGELESDQSSRSSERRSSDSNSRTPTTAQVISAAKRKAIPFTFGLILHGLADGCALGVSAIEETSSEGAASNLSLIVFLALLFHKGM